MAKNTSGAVHLTSLDLDISKISERLNTVKDEISETASDIVRTWNSGIESGGTVDILEKLGINDIPEAEKKIKALVDEIGNYQKLEIQAKGGELFKAIATQADESGISIKKVIDLTKDLKDALASASIVDTSPAVISKQAKKEKEEYYNAVIQYQKQLAREEENATKIALQESGKRNQARDRELESLKRLDDQSYSASMKSQEDYLISLERDVTSLSSAYEKLGERVNKSGLSDETTQKFTKNIQTVLDKLAAMQSDLSLSQTVPEGFESQLKNIQKIFNGLSKAIESSKKEQEEYYNALADIGNKSKTAISDLKVLEKSATFSNSRKEASALRAEFERLYSEIKSGSIDLQKAESQFSSLDEKLSSFKSTVQTGTSAFQNFVNKISESAKWQIANSLLNVLETALSNVVGTITGTENAVVELRRVLTDAPLAGDISSELYQIAYDFGQTFESVQETAVRFAQTGMGWQEVVEATRATMLGLNTAELEVTTATEGLIAVMAQFHIEAEDLESVIDKINITADNFPVTSEKIVAALQRAGGTASAFGLSLEETIGIITALSEATGRAGEAIGTAMNSLISFSMKDTALEKFSEFLGKDVSDYGVLELWQELSAAIKGGNTELAKMMSQSEEFSDLMDETLATSIGLEEEYNNALKEQNDALKEGKDIYSTVGTYRQNYFIALLNNIGTATEAIENMDGALGYSLQENETAMSTFTKQWNQLVVSAQELAIQFGEAGFLTILKFLADAGTAVLKLTKGIGGLITVLFGLSTVIIAVKKQKIDETWNSFNLSVKKSVSSLKNLKITAGTVATAISGLATVVSIAVSAYQAYKEKVNEAREASIESGKSAIDETNNLLDLYDAYKKARDAYDGTIEGSKNYTVASNNLREELKKQGQDVDGLASSYKEATGALEELTEAQIQSQLAEIYSSLDVAKEKFEDWADAFYGIGRKTFAKFTENQEGGYNYSPVEITSIEQAISLYEEYGEILDDIVEKEGGVAAGRNEDYQFISLQRKELEEQLRVYIDLNNRREELEKRIKKNNSAIRDEADAYTDLNEPLYEHIEGNKEVSYGWEQSVVSAESLTSSIESLKSKYDEISGSVDSFQSSIKTIVGVIEEYNETGNMTADMVQTILGLEPEYIDLLDISSNSISINTDKLNDLIEANDTRLQQLAAIKIAEEAAALAQQLSQMATEGKTEAEIIAAITTQELSGKVEQAAMAFLTGKGSADDLKKALSDYARQCDISGEAVDTYTRKLFNQANAQKAVLELSQRWPGDTGLETIDDAEMRRLFEESNIGKYYSPPPSSSGRSSSSSTKKDPFEEKLKAEKKAMDDLLDTYEHQIFLMEKNKASVTDIAAVYREMQEAVHRQADKYRDMGVDKESEYLRDLQKLWWEYQDEIEEVLNGIYEATVEANENAISLLENQYSKAAERMDYSEMSQNLQKQLEYQVKIQQEAHKEAERLRKLDVDENDEAIQACIDAWWKADNAIQEINSRIEESILSTYDDFIDLADQFDLWDYMDFTKADYLKIKLEDINKLLKEGTISLKEYNALLRQWNVDMFNARKELIEAQQTNIKNEADAVVKEYEASIDALEKRKEDVQSYYDGVIEGYEAEIEVWQKRKDEVEDYYDSLINNLNEVQEANDRINAQIDYYNARQKIITNLEQAQARSGVAWREKEMEYQQQLIDLDEDWNRTQEDWKIEDQIQQLEDLKEQATADIDATIEKVQQSIEAAEEQSKAAVDAIDQEIAGIQDTITAVEEQAELEIQALEDQITSLSEQFANAIKQGMSDGIVDSREEFDQAVEDGKNLLLGTIDENSSVMQQNAEETADKVMFCYNHSFLSPLQTGIDEVAEHMKTSIQSGAKTSAESALNTFERSFVSPLKSSIASLMNEVQKINISYNAKAASVNGEKPSSTSSKRTSYGGSLATGNRRTTDGPPATVYISNYNSTGEVAAKRTKNILQQILQ